MSPVLKNMVKYVNDIAGIRITCSFTSDITVLVDMIAKQSDLKILALKDYMKHPKESGYQSYHMLVTVQSCLTVLWNKGRDSDPHSCPGLLGQF